MQPNHILNSQIFSATSMGADATSTAVNINEVVTMAIQAVWSDGSTPVGVLILQVSNDGDTYTDADSQNVSGNSGSIIWNVERPGYGYVRLFYDRTSGSGTLNARLNGKRS